MLLQTICFAENQKEHVTFIWANKACMTSKQYTFDILWQENCFTTQKKPLYLRVQKKKAAIR